MNSQLVTIWNAAFAKVPPEEQAWEWRGHGVEAHVWHRTTQGHGIKVLSWIGHVSYRPHYTSSLRFVIVKVKQILVLVHLRIHMGSKLCMLEGLSLARLRQSFWLTWFSILIAWSVAHCCGTSVLQPFPFSYLVIGRIAIVDPHNQVCVLLGRLRWIVRLTVWS